SEALPPAWPTVESREHEPQLIGHVHVRKFVRRAGPDAFGDRPRGGGIASKDFSPGCRVICPRSAIRPFGHGAGEQSLHGGFIMVRKIMVDRTWRDRSRADECQR